MSTAMKGSINQEAGKATQQQFNAARDEVAAVLRYSLTPSFSNLTFVCPSVSIHLLSFRIYPPFVLPFVLPYLSTLCSIITSGFFFSSFTIL